MALTKEDLDKIKLPLSDEDYQMLRREDAKSCYKIWQLASPELRAALEHIVALLAVKFDANLTNKSEMIYDTVMSW